MFVCLPVFLLLMMKSVVLAHLMDLSKAFRSISSRDRRTALRTKGTESIMAQFQGRGAPLEVPESISCSPASMQNEQRTDPKAELRASECIKERR